MKDQYAVQRVLEVVRGEDDRFYLLLEYLGYRHLEVPGRLECRLVDKNSEPNFEACGPIGSMRTHDPASACSTVRGPFLTPCGMGNLWRN